MPMLLHGNKCLTLKVDLILLFEDGSAFRVWIQSSHVLCPHLCRAPFFSWPGSAGDPRGLTAYSNNLLPWEDDSLQWLNCKQHFVVIALVFKLHAYTQIKHHNHWQVKPITTSHYNGTCQDQAAMKEGGLVWWVTFFSCIMWTACASLSLGKDGTRVP